MSPGTYQKPVMVTPGKWEFITVKLERKGSGYAETPLANATSQVETK